MSESPIGRDQGRCRWIRYQPEASLRTGTQFESVDLDVHPSVLLIQVEGEVTGDSLQACCLFRDGRRFQRRSADQQSQREHSKVSRRPHRYTEDNWNYEALCRLTAMRGVGVGAAG